MALTRAVVRLDVLLGALLACAPAAAQPGLPLQGPGPAPAPGPGQAPPGQPAPAAAEDLGPSIVEDSWLLVAGGITLGAATEESFDGVLSSRGYAPASRVWGGEATVLFRTLQWLWVGGRLDLRARDWARAGAPSANAVGFGAMALAEARLRVNRNVDVGLAVGLGAGVIGLSINDQPDTYVSPKVQVGAPLAFTIADPARLFVRVAWDYMRATNFNEFGHDVNLSGASLTVGLEVRR